MMNSSPIHRHLLVSLRLVGSGGLFVKDAARSGLRPEASERAASGCDRAGETAAMRLRPARRLDQAARLNTRGSGRTTADPTGPPPAAREVLRGCDEAGYRAVRWWRVVAGPHRVPCTALHEPVGPGSLASALYQLAWAHLKAVVVRLAGASLARHRERIGLVLAHSV